jgi:hypothetical protein
MRIAQRIFADPGGVLADLRGRAGRDQQRRDQCNSGDGRDSQRAILRFEPP